MEVYLHRCMVCVATYLNNRQSFPGFVVPRAAIMSYFRAVIIYKSIQQVYVIFYLDSVVHDTKYLCQVNMILGIFRWLNKIFSTLGWINAVMEIIIAGCWTIAWQCIADVDSMQCAYHIHHWSQHATCPVLKQAIYIQLSLIVTWSIMK